MTPTRVRRFRVERAAPDEAEWLRALLGREGRRFGTGARLRDDGRIELVRAR